MHIYYAKVLFDCTNLLNLVKLSTLLIKKGSHKRYAVPTALVVV